MVSFNSIFPLSAAGARRHLPWLAASCFGLLLAWIARGGQIYLGHDEFRYVQMARMLYRGQFASLSSLWAWGFPATALPFMLFGAHAATALVIVSALSLALVLWISDSLLRERATPLIDRVVVLGAIASVPIWSELQFKPLSDALFSAGVMLLFAMLAKRPDRSRPAAVALLAAALFLVHFTGIVFLAVIPLILLLEWRSITAAGRARLFAWWSIACAIPALSLALIAFQSGRITGQHVFEWDPRVAVFAAQFGLNILGVLTNYIHGAMPEAMRALSGLAITVALLVASILVLHARTKDTRVRSAAVVILTYTAGLILLRCVSFFFLDQVRRAMPILPILAIAASVPASRNIVIARRAGFILLLLVGMLQSYRAAQSADPMLPVGRAERYLSGVLRASDKVFVNYQGKSILRTLDADVEFLMSSHDSVRSATTGDYVAILAGRAPDAPWGSAMPGQWRGLYSATHVTDARFECVHTDSLFLVFRRR
jgi:hypothetical protein